MTKFPAIFYLVPIIFFFCKVNGIKLAVPLVLDNSFSTVCYEWALRLSPLQRCACDALLSGTRRHGPLWCLRLGGKTRRDMSPPIWHSYVAAFAALRSASLPVLTAAFLDQILKIALLHVPLNTENTMFYQYMYIFFLHMFLSMKLIISTFRFGYPIEPIFSHQCFHIRRYGKRRCASLILKP